MIRRRGAQADMDSIYLDHNATAPILPEVAAAMAACHAEGLANPASQHQAGRRARWRLEQARDLVGDLLGARLAARPADRVVFTSGATESNHLALLGLAGAIEQQGGRRSLAVSRIEHPSGWGPAEQLQARGWTLLPLAPDPAGVISAAAVDEALMAGASLVSVMLGNHETGALQPVAEIAARCRDRGAWLHTDATQVVGKLPVDFGVLGAATLAASAHKFHGPAGVGLLLVRGDVDLEPVWRGGFQQAGLRPGTENVAGAVGLAAALEAWQVERESRPRRLAQLRDELERRLLAGDPGIEVIAAAAPRLPQTSCVAFVGLDRQQLLLALDRRGVQAASGSACASGSSEPSPVLLAMGCDAAWIRSAIRFSVGARGDLPRIVEAAERILLAVQDLRQGKSPAFSLGPTPVPRPAPLQ